MAGHGQAVASVVRGIMHGFTGRKTHTEENDETEHRGEKGVEFALRRNLRASVDRGMIMGVNGLCAHELCPLRAVGADGES